MQIKPYLQKLLQYSAISVRSRESILQGNVTLVFGHAMLSSSARHLTRVPRQCHQLAKYRLFYSVSLLDDLEYRGLVQDITRWLCSLGPRVTSRLIK